MTSRPCRTLFGLCLVHWKAPTDADAIPPCVDNRLRRRLAILPDGPGVDWKGVAQTLAADLRDARAETIAIRDEWHRTYTAAVESRDATIAVLRGSQRPGTAHRHVYRAPGSRGQVCPDAWISGFPETGDGPSAGKHGHRGDARVSWWLEPTADGPDHVHDLAWGTVKLPPFDIPDAPVSVSELAT